MFPHLAQPIRVGRITLNNRLAVAPTCRNIATEHGYVTDRLMDVYRALGKGGWGLVTVEIAAVRADGRNFERMLLIDKDDAVPGLAELAEAIHEGGAKCALQLLHGGRSAPRKLIGTLPVAPSEVRQAPPSAGVVGWAAGQPVVECRALSYAEVEEFLEVYARAARRTKEAGFDAVLLHGAHGFLPAQFMSPYFNRRMDLWSDRALFPLRLIERVRKEVGPHFTVGMRISGDEFAGKYGISLEDNLKWAPKFEEAGLDYLDVSAGTLLTPAWSIQPLYFPRGCITHLAEAIKKVVKIPVVTVGRINDPVLAEKIVADGKADIVAMSRPALADPELAKKALEGRREDIRKCIYCDEGCSRLLVQRGVQCTLNYAQGRHRYEYELKPAERPKKVLVVGGGVAGMEAARVAAIRRHNVALYEKDGVLGGAVASIASAIPRLYTRESYNAVEWLSTQLHKLEVKIELGTEVTPELVEKLQLEVVVLATGALPLIPDKPGFKNGNVITVEDYLKQRRSVGDKVVVLGGQHGSEVAVSLAREGRKVTLVEESDSLAHTPYLFGVRRMVLLGYLSEAKVNVLLRTKVKEIAERNIHFIYPEGKEGVLEADTIILAWGEKPDNRLAQALREKVPELYPVGDCVEPYNIMFAMHSAYRVAREI